jgi:hypothetical protein
MTSKEMIANKLSTLLKNWNNVDQAWWVNAVQHSFKHTGTFTLVGFVTTTGKDETIVANELVGA